MWLSCRYIWRVTRFGLVMRTNLSGYRRFWATVGCKCVLAGFVFSTANQWWAHPDPASAVYSIVSHHTCALAAQLLVVVWLCSYYVPFHMRCCGFPLLHCCQCRYEVAATTAAAVPLPKCCCCCFLSVFSYTIKINPDPRRNHCCGK